MSFTITKVSFHGPDATGGTILHEVLASQRGAYLCTEGYNLIDNMRNLPDYKLFVGESKTDPRRGARDVPILIKKGVRVVTWGATKTCDPSTPIKIAPERWITWVRCLIPTLGKVTLITAHPHAAVQGQNPKLDRVRKYAKSAFVLADRIAEEVDLGYEVIVNGDMQWKGGAGPSYAPGPLFRHQRMKTWNVGIDWMAWTHGLHLPPGPQFRHIIKAGHFGPGQDHPILTATFASM